MAKAKYELKTISNKLKVRGKMTGDSLTLNKGDEVTFAAQYSGHTWSEDEIGSLLHGDTVTYTRYGEVITGALGKQKYFGKEFVGFTRTGDNLQVMQEFVKDVNDGKIKAEDVEYTIKNDAHGRPKVYFNWFHKDVEHRMSFAAKYKDHTWTDAEIKDLLTGKGVGVKDVDGNGKSQTVPAHLDVQRYMGKYYVGVRQDYIKEAEAVKDVAEVTQRSSYSKSAPATQRQLDAKSEIPVDDIVVHDPEADGPEFEA